jgi:rhodanese-related sulfurtransferase
LDSKTGSEAGTIDVEKLKRLQMLHVRFLIFDVRSHEAYSQGHIQSAFNISASEFKANIEKQVVKKDTPIIVYDQDGSSIAELVIECEQQGYINMVMLEGGFTEYSKHYNPKSD